MDKDMQNLIDRIAGAYLPIVHRSNEDARDGSVGVYVVKNGMILSGTRRSGDGSGLICGPGGHIEKGETPEAAAIRETQEEFGITPTELIPIGLGNKESDGHQPNLFLCVKYAGEPQCLSDEMTIPVFRRIEDYEMSPHILFEPFKNGLAVLRETVMKAAKDGDLLAG